VIYNEQNRLAATSFKFLSFEDRRRPTVWDD